MGGLVVITDCKRDFERINAMRCWKTFSMKFRISDEKLDEISDTTLGSEYLYRENYKH